MITVQGICILAFLLGLIVLALVSQTKINDEKDFIVAGRKLPLYLAWGTLLATWYGAGSVIGATQSARTEGLSGSIALDPLSCGFSLILVGFVVAGRIWHMELLTTGDLYARVFGKKTELASSIIQAISYFPWIASQYVALGMVFKEVFGIPEQTGIFLAAAISIVLTISGGMWSVTLTDTAQIVLVMIGMAMIFFQVLLGMGEGDIIRGLAVMPEKTPAHLWKVVPNETITALLGWVAMWSTGLFGNMPGQDLMQRVFASKSAATARNACILAGVVYLIMGVIPVTIGMSSHFLLQGDDDSRILMRMADAALHPAVKIVFFIALLGAVISTATSAILSPACLMGKNILQYLPGQKGNTLMLTKISVVMVALVSIPFALFATSILDLLDQALGITFVGLFLPFLVALYAKKPQGDLRGMISVCAGSSVWLLHLILQYQLPELEADQVPSTISEYLVTFVQTCPPEFTGLLACLLGLLLMRKPSLSVVTELHPVAV
jgi:Na+/proline symporter